MNLQDYAKALAEPGIDISDAILSLYSENLKSLSDALAARSGLKADLVAKQGDDTLDIIRFAAFANDLTTLSLGREGSLRLSWFTPEGVSRINLSGLKFSLTAKQAEELRHVNGGFQLAPGFLVPDGERTKRTLDEILPLIESGRVLPRPTRIITALKETDQSGRNTWHANPVADSSPAEDWSLADPSPQEPVRAVEGELGASDEQRMFQLTFPFLKGVGFRDLAKILDDEEHHIAKARTAIADLVKEQRKGGLETDRMLAEVVRPELDTLSRKFEHLASSRALRTTVVGIGVVTMTLVAGATAGFGGALLAAGGSTGAGLLLKDWADSTDKLFEAKERPLYLLWRLRQQRRTAE